MKLLFITSEVPYPPASGGSLRVWGLVRGLAKVGHQVTLLCLQEKPIAPELAAVATVITTPLPARTIRQRLQTLLTTAQPDIARRLYDPAVTARILQLHAAHAFDLIQFEGIESACYLLPVRAALPAVQLVFDTFNAEADMQTSIARIDAQTPRRWLKALYSWVQSRRIAAYEGHLCRRANLVLAVSAEDQALLMAYKPVQPVQVVPSGITVDDYAQRSVADEDQRLVFTGKMDYRPNIDAVQWFVTHILPSLPQARLSIVGQQPSSAVQALASDQVEVTGRVASVIPYLQRAAVYIAPLRMGSGTRLKILEALACECAIVTTSLGASGLNEAVRAGLVIADDAAAFATAVRLLLDDPDQRRERQLQARALVRQHYDWEVILPRLLNAYKCLA